MSEYVLYIYMYIEYTICLHRYNIVKVRPSVPRHLVSWPMGELTKCSLVPANFRPLINISNIFKCCCAIFHVCNYAVKVD